MGADGRPSRLVRPHAFRNFLACLASFARSCSDCRTSRKGRFSDLGWHGAPPRVAQLFFTLPFLIADCAE